MAVTEKQAQAALAAVKAKYAGYWGEQAKADGFEMPEPKRTAGRGASSFNGSVGAMGNLAAGRILSALETKGLVQYRRNPYTDEMTSRRELTEAGRKLVKPATLLELHARGELA